MKPGFKVARENLEQKAWVRGLLSYADIGVFTGDPSLSPSMLQSGSAGVAEHPLASGLETGNGWSAHHGSRGNIYLVFRTR